MPVAKDPWDTPRLFIDYVIGTFPRVAQFRCLTLAEAASLGATFSDFVAANATRFGDNVDFLGARVADLGSNVSNPIEFTPVAGTGASIAVRDTPRFCSWYGRDTMGYQVKWFLYGVNFASPTPGDYRLTGEEDVNVSALSGDFRDLLAEFNVTTINGSVPIVANYVNVGYNAYHQRKLRG